MKISISNIAWDVSEDENIVPLLKRFHVDAIDIAPGKYFQNILKTNAKDVAEVRRWWSDHGVVIVGMQSLLFGTQGLNIFENTQSQNDMLEHLSKVCEIGGQLGAKFLVFGSPKNRDRMGLCDEDALDIAVPFFEKLGDIAWKHGVTMCLEPNPSCYGSNFMVNTSETASVVRKVNHPAIRMQLDTGALVLNDESSGSVISENLDIIAHVHVSEPHLIPLGDAKTDHLTISRDIFGAMPEKYVTIEMVATQDECHLIAIERALKTVTCAYRDSFESLGDVSCSG